MGTRSRLIAWQRRCPCSKPSAILEMTVMRRKLPDCFYYLHAHVAETRCHVNQSSGIMEGTGHIYVIFPNKTDFTQSDQITDTPSPQAVSELSAQQPLCPRVSQKMLHIFLTSPHFSSVGILQIFHLLLPRSLVPLTPRTQKPENSSR